MKICSKNLYLRTYVWYNSNISIHVLERSRVMLRARIVPIQASKPNVDRLFACNRESAHVWNVCLQLSKDHYTEHQKWISQSELQKQTKGRFHLHSQSIQAVCHNYVFARDSTYQAIQKGIKTARYPYKNKNHTTTKWPKMDSRCLRTVKSNYPWAFIMGKERNPLWCIPTVYLRDR